MRSRLRAPLAAQKYVHARRRHCQSTTACGTIRTMLLTRGGVRSRARTAPRITSKRPALIGGLGGPCCAARATTRAKVCPPPPAYMRTSRLIDGHGHARDANTCLRSRFAAVALLMDSIDTTTIVGAGSAVLAAAPPLPMAFAVPLRHVRVAASVCGVPRP